MLKWNRKSRCYDLHIEKPIRYVPLKRQNSKEWGLMVKNGSLLYKMGVHSKKWGLMVLLVLFFVLFWVFIAHAEPCNYNNDQIVNAIERAENSTKYPFGVRSINTHGDYAYARQICLNSVRKARARWHAAGDPGDFITFIGKRYSPPAQNPHWVRNVKFYLNKQK